MVVQGIGLVTDLRSQNKNLSNLYLASGLVTAGDNQGGIFYWNPSSTAADDGVNVLQVTGVATGRWIRISTTIQVSAPLTYTSGVLGITQSGTSSNGYLSSTDWNTFNNKQNAITLTTTGTSGPATFVGSILNIPQYQAAGSYVPTSRTLTINGSSYDLSADRTWSVGTVTSMSFTIGTTGTDVNSSVATSTTTPAITLNIPIASATNTGKLSNTDWVIFNAKQGVIMLTTTGTSGAATFVSNTLNIPQYQGQITLTTTGSSGPSTLVGNTLNVPDYSTALTGYVPTSRTLTINGTTYDLTVNRSWSVGTVTSVSLATDTAGTDIAVSGSPVTNGGTITLSIPVASATKTGKLTSADWTTFNNKQNALTFGNLTETTSAILTITGGSGAVIGSGVTIQVAQASNTTSGYLSSTDWVIFNGKQAAITLTTTGNSGAATFVSNTLNIPNYTLSGLGGVPTSRQLTINGTAYDLSANRSWSVGTVTSVGLSMPSAFTVSNSPVTGSGTLTVTGAGSTSQYIRGDGTLADFPGGGGGGGSSVSYYLNGGTNQGTFGGNVYYQMSKTAVTGSAANFTINGNGYIAEFLTDAGDPGLLNIPAGNWDIQAYFSASSAGGSPQFYVELYKYNGSGFTLIATSSGSPEVITGGTSVDLYYTTLAVPATVLTITDRLAVRFYVTHDSRTITMYTQDAHLAEIHTTFSTGITALNGLTAQVQYLATSTTGTDFTISSATDTHTFNLPVASSTKTGKLSSTDWTTFNNKQSALTFGNLTEATSSVLTVTGGTGAVIGSGTTIQVKQASGSQSGYLSSTDWTTFNNKLTSPMTTLGDIIYGAAAGAATRLAGNTTITKQYLSQTGDGTNSAAPSWAAISGGDITGAALTKSDDTNVTLTLGGTPSTALLRAASLTLGWTGTLAISRGGTGASSKATAFDNLSPMTTLGDLIYGSTSGSNTRLAGNTTTAKQYLSQTGDGTVSAAPIWATITGSDITGAALTKTDDTNVTLTLGGTPATSLLRAASLTLGWTGSLAVGRGGTGITTYTLGDTLYSSATNTLAKLSGNTTTIKKFLTQTGDGTNSAAPSWGTISSSDLPALPNAVTFNNGGSGAASGTTFDGSVARTISYNTIGAQPLLTNPVTGTGTTNYLPKFTAASTIGNSGVSDDGTTVTLNSRALSGTTASFTTTLASGAANSFAVTHNQANSTDTGDVALSLSHTITANTATNELVLRAFSFGTNNNLTGGGTVQNYRGWNVASSTQTGTTTTDLDQIYIEKGTSSGTVTNNRAIRINNMQGTNQAGFVANAFSGTNNTYLLLGTAAIPSGKWGIYQSESTYNNNFAGKVFINTTTDAGYNLDVNGTGRFTGALSGTSATFSGVGTFNANNGAISVSGTGYTLNPTNMLIGRYTSTRGYVQVPTNGTFEVWDGGTSTIAIFSETNKTTTLYGALSGTSATFASTAYTNLTVNGTNATGWGNNIAFQSGGTDFGYVGSYGSLVGSTTKDMTVWATSGNGFRVNVNGGSSSVLTISSTGAATFSSSVTATGGFEIPNGQFYRARRSSGSLLTDMIGIPSGSDDVRILTTGDFNIINGSLTNILTVKNGGNVGIGTTSPTSIGTYYTTLELKGKSGGTGNEGGYLLTVDADGSTTGQFGTDGNYVYFGSRSNTDAVVTTNNTERMRITSGGNLEFNNSNATAYVYINQGTSADGGVLFRRNNTNKFQQALSTPGDALIWYNYAASGESMRITSGGLVNINDTANTTYRLYVAGSVGASGGFFDTSDLRVKTIIERNPALDINVDLVKYTKKGDSKVRYGYIAQEVQAINSDVVEGSDILSLNYQDIHSIKIAALEKEIRELKAKLAN